MNIRVYDAQGREQGLEWALEKYRPLISEVPSNKDRWAVVELHEVIGPSSMTVRLKGDQSLYGIHIAFHWPAGEDGDIGDQKETDPSEPKPYAVKQSTNAEGQTGFGMGGGAYYRPSQGESGPHAVWVAEYPSVVSDLADGLGMIAGTEHAHLEPTFQFVEGEEEPEPEPGDELVYAIELKGTLSIRKA